jgi:hypothetical protein
MTDTLTTEELTTIAHYTQAINLLTHRTHQTTDPEAKTFLQNITPKFTTNKGRPIHINTKHWPHSTDLTLNTDPTQPDNSPTPSPETSQKTTSKTSSTKTAESPPPHQSPEDTHPPTNSSDTTTPTKNTYPHSPTHSTAP